MSKKRKTKNSESDFIISRKKASTILGVSERTVDRLIRAEKLVFKYNSGRVWLSQNQVMSIAGSALGDFMPLKSGLDNVSRQVGSGAGKSQEKGVSRRWIGGGEVSSQNASSSSGSQGLSRQGQGASEAQIMGGHGSLDSVSRQVGSGAVESQEMGLSRQWVGGGEVSSQNASSSSGSQEVGLSRQGQGASEAQVMGGHGSLDNVSRQVGSGAEERQEMGLSRQGQGTPEAQVMGGDGSLDSVSRQVGSGAVESQEKGVSRRSQGHGGFGVSTLESELIKSLTIQTEEDRKRLEAANYRIGYLEAQLETYISPYEHNQEREFLLLQSQKLISECEKKETQIALLMSHKYKIRKTIILTILGLVLVFGLVRLIGGSGFF